MPCRRAFPQTCIRETVDSKTKAKASETKTRISCITEAHESTRQRIESVTKRIHEEHIMGKGQNSVLHDNVVHKFYSNAASDEDSRCKGSSGQGREKARDIPSIDTGESHEHEGVYSQSTKRQKVHYATVMDMCHLKITEWEPKLQKIAGQSCTPWSHCKRRFRSLRSFLLNRARLRPKWLPPT